MNKMYKYHVMRCLFWSHRYTRWMLWVTLWGWVRMIYAVSWREFVEWLTNQHAALMIQLVFSPPSPEMNGQSVDNFYCKINILAGVNPHSIICRLITCRDCIFIMSVLFTVLIATSSYLFPFLLDLWSTRWSLHN